ncbi:MAG: hypothetical protein QOD96_4952 [Pseudonocardiales bacterium]|nr:hypothetical protein [Pseudonocardiales bacterium]
MPVFINGLPVHVLVVHAVVMLVPLAVLGSIAVTFWPAARRRYGPLVVAVTFVATASIPLATSAGKQMRDRLPTPPTGSEKDVARDDGREWVGRGGRALARPQ